MMKQHTTVKKRLWAFVMYPDSMPNDAIDILKQSGLPCAISPLHDKDLNPDDVEKKPHYHVILVYSGPTTYNAVSKFTASLNATVPQPLESVRGYYRYLTHKDNPEKFQYDDNDIVHLNGFNISDFVELTKSEIVQIKIKVQQFIREFNITEYSELMDMLFDNELMVEYEIASNNTLFFNSYVSSRRHVSNQKDKG